jgi:hypothetical protein
VGIFDLREVCNEPLCIECPFRRLERSHRRFNSGYDRLPFLLVNTDWNIEYRTGNVEC